MKTLLVIGVLAALWSYFAQESLAAEPAQKRPMKIDDLFKFQRVADPQISPDGKLVVYQVTTVNAEANSSTSALWIADTDAKTPPKQFTSPNGKKDMHPRWSRDGKWILFDSTRSGSSQIWVIGLEGGEARQLTNISTGASNGTWSGDNKSIAFVSSIYPEFSELLFAESDKKNAEKDKAIEDSPVKAKVFTKLFYRHWDEYVGDKRQHLFVITWDAKTSTWSAPHDCTPGDRDANPSSSTFSAGQDFTFTPDSQHLVFTATPTENEAWSTNYELCRVKLDNKSTKWDTLTTENKAADNCPKFSPDGKKLAYRAQKKPGYEADRWEITIRDCNPDGTLVAGKPFPIQAQDVSVDDFIWLRPDSIMGLVEMNASSSFFQVSLDANNKEVGVMKTGFYDIAGSKSSMSYSSANGYMTFTTARMDMPAEVTIVYNDVERENRILSNANTTLLNEIDRTRPESVKVKVEGAEMQMWILKPPGFDPAKKWPLVYMIHGGPQGAWEDGWSYRWNPQIWAAQGYVVALPNPRGSTGFGQKFVDEISGDWGGKCYRDLVAGLESLKKLPYIDASRIGSSGASFGGYMQNWFAVSDIAKDLKCQINHCSVWNFESMWGTTDELWFDEWEHQGLPWEKAGSYAEFSPHKKAAKLKENKVPMLIIHNDLDFRCPIGQGHELFTTLQRLGVKSKFINFPDEGHWVLKPKNSQYWHKEVFAWLNQYVAPGGK